MPDPIDHVLGTAGGPHYGPLLEMDADEVRHAVTEHLMLEVQVARYARGKMRAGGTLLFMSGTGGREYPPWPRHPGRGHGRALPVTAALALELAASARQSHRRRVRRHPVVGIAARRRARGPA